MATEKAVVYVRLEIDASQQDAYTIVDDVLDGGAFQDEINEYAEDEEYGAASDPEEAATVIDAIVDDLSRAREFVREVVLALGGNDGNAEELEKNVFFGAADVDSRVSRAEVLRRVKACAEKASAAEAIESDHHPYGEYAFYMTHDEAEVVADAIAAHAEPYRIAPDSEARALVVCCDDVHSRLTEFTSRGRSS